MDVVYKKESYRMTHIACSNNLKSWTLNDDISALKAKIKQQVAKNTLAYIESRELDQAINGGDGLTTMTNSGVQADVVNQYNGLAGAIKSSTLKRQVEKAVAEEVQDQGNMIFKPSKLTTIDDAHFEMEHDPEPTLTPKSIRPEAG